MKDKIYSPTTVFLKILIFGILFSALYIVLERSQAYVSSDVALTFLVRPLNIGIILCEAVSFFIGYALLLVSVSSFGVRKSISSFLLLIAFTLAKHLGDWMVFLITEKVTSAINIRLSALTAVSSIFLELIQHALVIVVCLVFFGKDRQFNTPSKNAIFAVCGIMLAVNLISRIITDINYGAPTSTAEVWVMVAYYLSDILLYGVIAYAVIRQIQKHECKKCPAIH